jgi:hypothetical protein
MIDKQEFDSWKREGSKSLGHHEARPPLLDEDIEWKKRVFWKSCDRRGTSFSEWWVSWRSTIDGVGENREVWRRRSFVG